MDVIKELERRQAMLGAISATVDRLFELKPEGRMRRDAVHKAISKEMGVLVVNSIPARQIVIEVLKSKGVRLISNTGRRFFKGIQCKTK